MSLGPLACLTALILLALLFSKRHQSWSAGLISAATVHSCFCMMIVQLLSYFSILQPQVLLCSWISFAILIALAVLRDQKQLPPFPVARISWLASGVIVYLLVLLFIALVAPPNTWDSMSYHMCRVMYWIQNSSLTTHATSDYRQIAYSPGAEYSILNFQMLSGNDSLANLVQWWSMLLSVIACSQIPRLLGARPIAGSLASIYCLTLPMGILQSTSTQTDYAAAGWMISAVYFALLALAAPQKSKAFGWTILLAISLGLALLFKGTAAIILAPFVLAFAVIFVRKFNTWSLLPAVVSCCIVGVIISSFYSDNWNNFDGKFFSYCLKNCQRDVTSQLFTPGATASTVVRNSAQQLATTSFKWNLVLEGLVAAIHPVTGLSVDDSRTTYPNCQFSLMSGELQLQEDWAGYPAHVLLAMIVMAACLIRGIKGNNKGLIWYGVLVFSSYLFLCTMLRWQPWGTRLFLPIFVLASPWLGGTMAEIVSDRTIRVACGILLIVSLPWLFANRNRPLFGSHSLLVTKRESNYFSPRPDLEEQYKQAATLVAKLRPAKIFLVLGPGAWEYPLWVLLSQQMPLPKIEGVRKVVGPLYENQRIDAPAQSLLITLENPAEALPYEKNRRLLLRRPNISLFAPVDMPANNLQLPGATIH